MTTAPTTPIRRAASASDEYLAALDAMSPQHMASPVDGTPQATTEVRSVCTRNEVAVNTAFEDAHAHIPPTSHAMPHKHVRTGNADGGREPVGTGTCKPHIVCSETAVNTAIYSATTCISLHFLLKSVQAATPSLIAAVGNGGSQDGQVPFITVIHD